MRLLKACECIRDYGVSEHNDRLDRQHVDAWFTTLKGKLVIFQIKSSESKMVKHLRKYPEIPCLNLGDCKLPAEAAVLIQETFDLPSLYVQNA